MSKLYNSRIGGNIISMKNTNYLKDVITFVIYFSVNRSQDRNDKDWKYEG